MPDTNNILQSTIAKWISIFTLISMLGGALVWADNRWDQRPLLVAEYAKNEDVKSVQKQVDNRFVEYQIQQYQDELDIIKDKEIEGTASQVDLKKKHRYETKINDLKEKIR